MKPDGIAGVILDALDEAFERKSWHGPNLRGSLRGLPEARAAWRPGPGRHNAWEVAVHVAYWKYAVRRRLTGEKRGSFALAGSNWFERETGYGQTFRQDVALLVAEHKKLREAIARTRFSGPADPRLKLVRGIAAHDLYHAGQIQLLKRLCPL